LLFNFSLSGSTRSVLQCFYDLLECFYKPQPLRTVFFCCPSIPRVLDDLPQRKVCVHPSSAFYACTCSQQAERHAGKLHEDSINLCVHKRVVCACLADGPCRSKHRLAKAIALDQAVRPSTLFRFCETCCNLASS